LSAVTAATQAMSVDGKGHNNLAFVQKEAFKLNDDWTEKFDWVSVFKSVHDQKRPDLVRFLFQDCVLYFKRYLQLLQFLKCLILLICSLCNV
jgi:hypothetical protein